MKKNIARKKQINNCVKIRRKSIKSYMDKVSQKSIETKKDFWKFSKLLLTNKETITGNGVILINGKNMIRNGCKIANTYGEHYIKIVEKSSDHKPVSIGSKFKIRSLKDGKIFVEKNIESCQNHPSIGEI